MSELFSWLGKSDSLPAIQLLVNLIAVGVWIWSSRTSRRFDDENKKLIEELTKVRIDTVTDSGAKPRDEADLSVTAVSPDPKDSYVPARVGWPTRDSTPRASRYDTFGADVDYSIEERKESLKDDGGASVGVWYATNRDRTKDTTDPNDYFGWDRSDLMKYGLVHVRIPPTHVLGQLERPPAIWKWEWSEDARKHVVLTDLSEYSIDTFFDALSANLERDGAKRPALVFVHGFNVTFAEAARKTAQVAFDLFLKSKSEGAADLTVMPILFSWPSKGAEILYPHDVSNANYSTDELGLFLRNVRTRGGVETIYVLAHSMGNRVLAGALQKLGLTLNASEQPLLKEVIMAAPDVDEGEFRKNQALDVLKTAARTTIYASDFDKALQLSKKFNGYTRLGDARTITALSGADMIDASSVGDDILRHSYYGAPSMLGDLYSLIRHGAAPGQRFGLLPIGEPPKYWQIRARGDG